MHVVRTARLSAATLLAVVAPAACGSEATTTPDEATNQAATTKSSVTVEDPWVRATTGTKDPSMSAAFMVLDNDGDQEVTVTGASSPVTDMVELHEMALVDGQSVMQEVQGGITLAPGRGQLLQPGGMHVMLMGLNEELAPGDEVDLTLELSDGSSIQVSAPVKEFTEETEHYHAPGTPTEHEHE